MCDDIERSTCRSDLPRQAGGVITPAGRVHVTQYQAEFTDCSSYKTVLP